KFQLSVARFCNSTAAFLSPIAAAVSSVSRLPTVAAITARTAIVIDTLVRNGSPKCRACWAWSACSTCSVGVSDIDQFLVQENRAFGQPPFRWKRLAKGTAQGLATSLLLCNCARQFATAISTLFGQSDRGHL